MKNYLKSVVFCTENSLAAGCLEVLSEGVLYITDKEECLNVLKERGLPVAAWLHEGNRGQDFSAAAYAIENPEEVEQTYYEKIYRRERGIPWDILETERCLVREMVPEDAETFAAIYREPAVKQYMKDFHGDVEGERRYIEEYQQQYRFCEYGVWSVVLKETGEVIGRVGFSEMGAAEGDTFIRFSNGKDSTKEIRVEEGIVEDGQIQFGYMIALPWQGQGLATEVSRAVLEYADAEWGFRKMYLKVEKENAASIRLAEKLGFVHFFTLIKENTTEKYDKKS